MRGERRIKFPNACFSSTGRLLIHGLSSFSHHSFSLLSLPITPRCCAPPLSSPHSLQASLHILSCHLNSLTSCLSLPVALHPILHPLFPLLFSFSSLLFHHHAKFSSSISLLYFRTLGTMAPCTSPRWQLSTWGTTVAMPTAMKTSIRHMCCRWMVSSGSFLSYSVGEVWKNALVLFVVLCGSPVREFVLFPALLTVTNSSHGLVRVSVEITRDQTWGSQLSQPVWSKGFHRYLCDMAI